MGLFTSKKNPCPFCGGPTPRLLATTIEGAPICGNCKDKIDLPDGTANLSLEDARQYLAYYDENKAQRDIFSATFKYNFSGWNDLLQIDVPQRLFRIRDKGDSLVMEPSCLKAFRILEDNTVLFESTPEGLKWYESDTPARVKAVEPEIDRYHADMDRYMQAKRMNEMIEEMEKRGDVSRGTPTPFISEPIFSVDTPIKKFYVELTLDHPYWGGVRTWENNAPDWGVLSPSYIDFMRKYEKETELLHTLATSLMSVIDPDAPPEEHILLSAPAGAAAAPAVESRSAADPVAEIQRYKALLDSGVITEEEFAAKKRQLLGI